MDASKAIIGMLKQQRAAYAAAAQKAAADAAAAQERANFARHQAVACEAAGAALDEAIARAERMAASGGGGTPTPTAEAMAEEELAGTT